MYQVKSKFLFVKMSLDSMHCMMDIFDFSKKKIDVSPTFAQSVEKYYKTPSRSKISVKSTLYLTFLVNTVDLTEKC